MQPRVSLFILRVGGSRWLVSIVHWPSSFRVFKWSFEYLAFYHDRVEVEVDKKLKRDEANIQPS